uniref:Uncharacterized protein n=1 Tax=Panagrolaimus superbus TaxID=310955 RepID=A0A914Y0G1_9BILA
MFFPVFSCYFALIHLTFAASIYQRCTQLSTKYNLLDSSNTSIVSFSANFDYIKLHSSAFNIVIIDNITSFADYHEIDVLLELDSYVDDVDTVCWLDAGCQLYVENSFLALFLNAQNGTDIQNFLVFKGLIDEKSFSLDDGFIFSKDQRCHIRNKNTLFGFENVTAKFQTCCTSFDPPFSLPTIIVPKCIEFQSRSTIYNTDDNYSIFATLKAEYSLTKDQLIIKTNYSGPDDSTYQLSANGLINCNGNNNYLSSAECEFPIKNFNTKILINIRMQKIEGSDSWEFDYNGGRLIIFENETLMSEGKPFTIENNCFYFSHNYSVPKVAQSQFCCSKFEAM